MSKRKAEGKATPGGVAHPSHGRDWAAADWPLPFELSQNRRLAARRRRENPHDDTEAVTRADAAFALRELRHLGLTNTGIRALAADLRAECAVARMLAASQGKGADRRALLVAAKTAVKLHDALAGLSLVAMFKLRDELERLAGNGSLAAVSELLPILAAVAPHVAAGLPPQDRHRARIGIVAVVARAVCQVPDPLPVSDDPKSRFHRAAAAGFYMAAVPGATTSGPPIVGAIRAYLTTLKQEPQDR